MTQTNRNYTDYATQKEVLLEYLQVKIAQGDWHGVADVAMDIREMEAATKTKEKQNVKPRGKNTISD